MTVCSIVEFYEQASAFGRDAPAPKSPPLVMQAEITVSGSSQQSAAFNSQTRFITVAVDGNVSIAIDKNPTASATYWFLPAGVHFFGVNPGNILAVISHA